MTTTEFKQKYPQYKDLEDDALWDKMTEIFLQSDNVLYADPNQEKVYSNPVIIDVALDNGNYSKSTFTVENSSTTRWLNKEGKLVRIWEIKKEPREMLTKSNTTYSGFIWNP